jgi:hypothetical protein
MPTNNSLLTDISQLDELNKEVWADSVRAREITQRVKPKFGDISSPSQNTVNEPESKATETLPPFRPNGAMRLVSPKRSIC